MQYELAGVNINGYTTFRFFEYHFSFLRVLGPYLSPFTSLARFARMVTFLEDKLRQVGAATHLD